LMTHSFFLSLVPPPPSSTLFPYTTLFRSRAVAEEGFALMQQKGMRLKRVTLTAKDKICFLAERLCNPDDCPYARGYYDRVQDVLDRKSTRLNSSHVSISYAVFCLKKKTKG